VNRDYPRPFARLAAAAVLAAASSTLAACGGAPDDPARPHATAVAAPPPLFDERRQPHLTPPALVPVDPAARTRSGLYATREQLAWEELVAATCTVVIDVDAVGSPAAAFLLAEQVRWWRDTRGLSFFVRSRDPLATARTADALSDAGFAPVFAVHGS
jgi:hypothetical protein